MPRTPVVSPKVHEELTLTLEQLLDEQDDLKSKKALISRAINVEIKTVGECLRDVRDRLKGREVEQVEIPGTEVVQRRRDRVVTQILKAATKLIADEEEREERNGKRFGEDPPPPDARTGERGEA